MDYQDCVDEYAPVYEFRSLHFMELAMQHEACNTEINEDACVAFIDVPSKMVDELYLN